jgi:hypothetical protein
MFSILAGAGLLFLVFVYPGEKRWLRKDIAAAGQRYLDRVLGIDDPEKYYAQEPVKISSAITSTRNLVSGAIIAVLWNSIVWKLLFVFGIPQTLTRGEIYPELWFVYLMFGIFIMLGFLWIYSVIISFISLYNPHILILIDKRVIPLGEAVALQWEFSGRTHLLESLVFEMEGVEESKHTVGTTIYTDKNVFYYDRLMETKDSDSILKGCVNMAVPVDTMHTFAADKNRIYWRIKVKAGIRNRPSIDEEHTLIVSPEKR